MIWPVNSAKTVVQVCKSIKRGEMHTVDLDVELAPPPDNPDDESHPRWTVTLRETPALFDSDTEFVFHAGHPDANWVAAVLRKYRDDLNHRAPETDMPAAVQWYPDALESLAKIAKRRGKSIEWYRSRTTNTMRVQIGETWLGLIVPMRVGGDDERTDPTVDPILGGAAVPA